MADVEALQKVLEMAKEIEVPTSMLFKDVVAEVVEQALKSAAELQMDVTAEAENLLLPPSVEGVQMVSTAGSEAMSSNTSTHPEPVIHTESDSNPSLSSSSTDSDDIPIGTLLKSIHSPSPSSKLQKKPTQPYEPMEPPVEVRISELLELRSSKLPPNHPLQPQTIQPLNMIIPNQPEDNFVLNNLSSHLSGELPNVEINLQKASEVTTVVVASKNQHQPDSELQMTSPNPEQLSTTVLEKPFPEKTGSDHTSSPPPSEMDVEYDGMITSKVSDDEIEQSSSMEIEQSSSDQPSSSITQSLSSINQPTDNLQIEPFAAPKPRKLLSQPTIFLDSVVLQGVCEDIADKMIKLLSTRNDLSHKESYDKQWKRLKERVENVMITLSTTCIEAQEQAKHKLQDWLNGIDESLEEVKILGTWARTSLSIRGRKATDFLPQYIHPKDLDLSFLTKLNLKTAAPDLALV